MADKQTIFRKTKIICTIGPASAKLETLKAMINVGMDIARLNFSHGTYESHYETIENLRQASRETGRRIGILQDLCGPKIRLGKLQGEVTLVQGEQVALSQGEKSIDGSLPVNYPYLVEDVALGARILLADGLVELVAEEKQNDRLMCRVINGGVVTSQKGVNLPLSKLRIQAFTEKDKNDLMFGLEVGVDFVAMSFVRDETDLAPILEILSDLTENRPMLLAKIEKPRAVESLDKILAVVDGIMVARGDLGVETPYEKLPIIQKRIITAARKAAKPVITATQMLRSMVDHPRPTRAEATDTANAILDGTDAVMLSEETAMGAYPVKAVNALNKIALATEEEMDYERYMDEPASPLLATIPAEITKSACSLSNDLGVKCVVTITSFGYTPRMISRLRPRAPILAISDDESVLRQLELTWGVVTVLGPTMGREEDGLLEFVFNTVRERNVCVEGDRLALVYVNPYDEQGKENVIKIVNVPGALA
ncbi:MAG: pyruvate kinase [Nitrospinota bacterium]|nr:pyruvate kinase [Nitrospinota bacterium]